MDQAMQGKRKTYIRNDLGGRKKREYVGIVRYTTLAS